MWLLNVFFLLSLASETIFYLLTMFKNREILYKNTVSSLSWRMAFFQMAESADELQTPYSGAHSPVCHSSPHPAMPCCLSDWDWMLIASYLGAGSVVFLVVARNVSCSYKTGRPGIYAWREQPASLPAWQTASASVVNTLDTQTPCHSFRIFPFFLGKHNHLLQVTQIPQIFEEDRERMLPLDHFTDVEYRLQWTVRTQRI